MILVALLLVVLLLDEAEANDISPTVTSTTAPTAARTAFQDRDMGFSPSINRVASWSVVQGDHLLGSGQAVTLRPRRSGRNRPIAVLGPYVSIRCSRDLTPS